MVVGHHGEFVGGEIVSPPDDEVAEVDARRAAHRAQATILELDHAAIGDAEPPRHAPWRVGPLPRRGPQRLRKNWLAAGGCVGRPRRLLDVAARVRAGIDRTRPLESPPHLEEPIAPPALLVGRVGAPDIGTFGPFEPEPAQVIERGGDKLRAAAVAVEILDPHYEAGPGRAAGGQRERAGMPHVEIAGRRRSEAAAGGHGGSDS